MSKIDEVIDILDKEVRNKRRERIATQLLVGILTCKPPTFEEYTVDQAVRMADMLIMKLEENKE